MQLNGWNEYRLFLFFLTEMVFQFTLGQMKQNWTKIKSLLYREGNFRMHFEKLIWKLVENAGKIICFSHNSEFIYWLFFLRILSLHLCLLLQGINNKTSNCTFSQFWLYFPQFLSFFSELCEKFLNYKIKSRNYYLIFFYPNSGNKLP